MPADTAAVSVLGAHGASRLPAVEVNDYNLEIKDQDDEFLGDRASKRAFQAILEHARKPLRKLGTDPFGKVPTAELSKKKIDAALESREDPDAAGLVAGAIEEFAQELAFVTRRFLRAKSWRDTERFVVGGGLRQSGFGERAIGRAGVILKAQGVNVDIKPIRHHPDEAGLIGATQLAPPWIFAGHDSILAVDIGGTNIRAGVVELNRKKAPDLSKAAVWKRELWRHRDDGPKRDEAIGRLVEMLEDLIGDADKAGLRLAPFIGIGCPGRVEPDGSIERGAQNLPGNWESTRFNLPARLIDAIPAIGDDETVVVMHNDAVVQGLSEAPFMRDVERWGVLTIGTGLGNARFSNRATRTEGAARSGGKSDKR